MSSSADGVVGGAFIPLTVDAAGISAAAKAKFPHLASAGALKIGPADLAKVPAALRGQLVVARLDGSKLVDATALQTAGALDDWYPYDGPLGAEATPDFTDGRALFNWIKVSRNKPSFRVWAPTAQSVNLVVYDAATGPSSQKLPMSFNGSNGVWSVQGNADWFKGARKYYTYEVTVFVRTTGKVETTNAPDPYSVATSVNSERSLMADLDDSATKPTGFDTVKAPAMANPEDIVIYELHLRDFSATDASVPAADRGKFRAFTYPTSNGMKHLAALQAAGLTHLHFLPVFDIASVDENGCVSPTIPNAGPDSQDQQAAVNAVNDKDCFNWGYDPVLFGVPEGSYASSATGLARVLEMRSMVQSLNQMGLRVVMDVVYNHTSSAGLGSLSVFDKIVPGYYYRLDEIGSITNSTCCQNTATEHNMMGKLLIDTLVMWAKQYKVNSFRFDLMGHQPKDLMVRLKNELVKIDPSMYLYGEGWNFGEVANNARFSQASQLNLAGTGIGTFSDRMRDAVRGGGPFDSKEDLIKNQGFMNGLFYDTNALAGAADAGKRESLLYAGDMIRLGIAGTPKEYPFTDAKGAVKRGADLRYGDQPAGYTVDPQEVINYISAHDNQTLFDINQYKLPTTTTKSDRVRANNLGVAIVAFSQGIPFFHAGDEMLRSKSLDRDSYNAGDWFNRIDWTFQSNNWAIGLPPSGPNQDNWPVMKPLLANVNLSVGAAEIAAARDVFLDMIKVRKSSPLFRLTTADDVQRRLKFSNVGPDQKPGLVVFTLSDDVGGTPLDSKYKTITVVINADKVPVTTAVPTAVGKTMTLHPVQLGGADTVVKGATFNAGSFTVPARTAAVFVEAR